VLAVLAVARGNNLGTNKEHERMLEEIVLTYYLFILIYTYLYYLYYLLMCLSLTLFVLLRSCFVLDTAFLKFYLTCYLTCIPGLCLDFRFFDLFLVTD